VASASPGLFLNVKKTEVLTTAGITSFKANSNEIEVVDHFDLLGYTIQEDGGCKKEVLRRLTLGRVTMQGLNKIW